jgi:lipopolysaccharide/colanic/teichoic acid biosynthesis glycosyltransferase
VEQCTIVFEEFFASSQQLVARSYRNPPLSTQSFTEVHDVAHQNAASGTLNATQPARSATQNALKRLQDVVISAFSLLILSPLLALIALIVKLQDGGPVIYRRRVVGPGGAFDAFKFRSMRVDADEILAKNTALRSEFERNFKLVSDPRVTKVGGWLRKLSLDELPQLFNVLRGEMSIVGPRMITAPELDKYGEFQALLLTVKPGLTGYWQVYGRQQVAYEDRVRMDIYYITHWNLAMDWKLLCLTPARVLKGSGAY